MQALGTKLNFSTAFHPQSDRQSERVIQILEDMLQACVLNYSEGWFRYLSLVEFAYNNSYQANIEMASYEVLYRHRCRSPICWDDLGKRKSIGPDLVEKSEAKICIARQQLLIAQSHQKSYADRRQRDLEFQVGKHILLKVSPTKEIKWFGFRGKLSPRFIRAFETLKRIGPVAYHLALLLSLDGCITYFT